MPNLKSKIVQVLRVMKRLSAEMEPSVMTLSPNSFL